MSFGFDVAAARDLVVEEMGFAQVSDLAACTNFEYNNSVSTAKDSATCHVAPGGGSNNNFGVVT